MPRRRMRMSAPGCLFHVVAEVVAELVGTYAFYSPFTTRIILISGAGGIRTPDLRRATTALFLLSYSPKVVVVREV